MTRLLDESEGASLDDIARNCARLANELGKQSIAELFEAHGERSKKLIMASRLLSQVSDILGSGGRDT